jgi:hypothetical protein
LGVANIIVRHKRGSKSKMLNKIQDVNTSKNIKRKSNEFLKNRLNDYNENPSKRTLRLIRKRPTSSIPKKR